MRDPMLLRGGWRASILLLTGSLLGGCAPECPEPVVSQADIAAIRTLHKQLDSLAGRGEWEGSARLYADDAVVMLPDRPALEGRAAIREYFAGWPPVGGSVDLLEVEPRGDVAYVRTRYRLTMSMPNGVVVADSGKGLEVWRKQPDGGWLLSRDISSSDVPRGR